MLISNDIYFEKVDRLFHLDRQNQLSKLAVEKWEMESSVVSE